MQEQRIPAPRTLQQLTTPLPHLTFKSALLKPFGEHGVLGAKPLISLRGPEIKLSLIQTPTFQFVQPHCTLGIGTCIQLQKAKQRCESDGARPWEIKPIVK